MTVRQTIVGRENMKTQLKTFTLENQSVENAKRISEQELKLAVSTQYISAFGILEEVLFHEEMEKFLKKEEALLKTLTEKGVYKITDYLHFQVTLQQHQLFIAQQKAEYRNHIALLNGLCGIIDTSFVVLEKPEMMLRPALSFENTLQYFNFQIDSLKIQNSAAAIDYAYRPKLDLFADAGYRSTFALDPYKNFGASIGFAIAIPIYNGGQRQQQHSKLRVSEQIRKNDQDYSRQQYRQQLNQLSLQLEQVEKIILQAQSVVTSSKILMDAYNKQMQTGDASISDYLLALNNYLNAKHLITQHENHKLQIINQINYWNHE
jgi:outer membrane protein TolC